MNLSLISIKQNSNIDQYKKNLRQFLSKQNNNKNIRNISSSYVKNEQNLHQNLTNLHENGLKSKQSTIDRTNENDQKNKLKMQIKKILLSNKINCKQQNSPFKLNQIIQQQTNTRTQQFSPIGKATNNKIIKKTKLSKKSSLSKNGAILKLPQIFHNKNQQFSCNVLLKQRAQLKNNNKTLDTRIETEGSSSNDLGNSSLVMGVKLQTKKLVKKSQQGRKQHLNQEENQQYQQQRGLISSDFSRIISSIQVNDNNKINRNIQSNNKLSRFYNNSQLNHQSYIYQQQKQQSQQQQQQQFEHNSTPGPGYYSISSYSQFSPENLGKRSKNRSITTKSFNFGSNQRRFSGYSQHNPQQNSQQNIQARQIYKQVQKLRQQRLKILNKKAKKQIPFNCQTTQKSLIKSLQLLHNIQGKDSPGPVYYNPRYGIEQDLIKKIQRNFKGNFGSEVKRFKTIYKGINNNLGPGCYDVNEIQVVKRELNVVVGIKNKENDNQGEKQSYYFVSNKGRFQ